MHGYIICVRIVYCTYLTLTLGTQNLHATSVISQSKSDFFMNKDVISKLHEKNREKIEYVMLLSCSPHKKNDNNEKITK